jgi:hypothetical protein
MLTEGWLISNGFSLLDLAGLVGIASRPHDPIDQARPMRTHFFQASSPSCLRCVCGEARAPTGSKMSMARPSPDAAPDGRTMGER